MTFLDDDELKQLIQDNLTHLARHPLTRTLYPELATSNRRDINIRRLPTGLGAPPLFEAVVDLSGDWEGDEALECREVGYRVTVPCESETEALEALLLALAGEVREYL